MLTPPKSSLCVGNPLLGQGPFLAPYFAFREEKELGEGNEPWSSFPLFRGTRQVEFGVSEPPIAFGA